MILRFHTARSLNHTSKSSYCKYYLCTISLSLCHIEMRPVSMASRRSARLSGIIASKITLIFPSFSVSQILLGARQNDVNAHIVLPGTHRFAKCMCLKSGHLLQLSPIYQNFMPSKILSSYISCNVIYNASGIFKS